VDSIEALLAEGLSQEGGTRSRKSKKQSEPVSGVLPRKREKNVSEAKQDPGVAIRKLAL